MDSLRLFPFSAARPSDTVEDICAPGALDGLGAACDRVFGPGPRVVISDRRIWDAVGGRLARFAPGRGDVALHLLPAEPPPYASYEEVLRVREIIRAANAVPVAVGSGTINDIVKRAAFELGRGYACAPTAPSVDGFQSFGAAITVDGLKLTLECPAPRLVVADEGVLAEAPDWLIASGFGDLAAKLPSAFDWIVADALGIEAVDRPSWDAVVPLATAILGAGPALRGRDRRAISGLYAGLAASGLAMQWYRDSRPASGAEHYLSHTWEMIGACEGVERHTHGFKVALGSLAMAAFQEELFGEGGVAAPRLARRGFEPEPGLLGRRTARARALLGPGAARDKLEETIAAKTPDAARQAERTSAAGAAWGRLRARREGLMPSFGRLKSALREVGCPVEPAALGLTRRSFLDGLFGASVLRTRYTILDLADELGLVDPIAEVLVSGNYFSEFAG